MIPRENKTNFRCFDSWDRIQMGIRGLNSGRERLVKESLDKSSTSILSAWLREMIEKKRD